MGSWRSTATDGRPSLGASAKLKQRLRAADAVPRRSDVDLAEAEATARALVTASLDGVEIELVDGGQPHYDFLIAAE